MLDVAALKLGGLVAAGELSDTEVVNTLYDAAADDGHRAAVATINSGMRKGLQEPRKIPEREAKLEVLKPEPKSIFATPYVWKDPATLRRRVWLYGYLLICKFVTATVAPGGVGKSSLGAVESSGRDQPLVIATTTRNGAVIARPAVDSLVAEIIKRKIDVIKNRSLCLLP
jgi:hypothetical protein